MIVQVIIYIHKFSHFHPLTKSSPCVTVPFRKDERITFKHLISIKKPYETALLKVLREGKEYEFNISLKPVSRHSKISFPVILVHHFVRA